MSFAMRAFVAQGKQMARQSRMAAVSQQKRNMSGGGEGLLVVSRNPVGLQTMRCMMSRCLVPLQLSSHCWSWLSSGPSRR